MIDTDVIIVGAGPTGLMLAGELRLGAVRTLVLERQPRIRDIPKAGGLSGQILELLRYRGLLERFEAASTVPIPALRLPFGGLHVDFTHLAVPPMQLLPLPQPRLDRVRDMAGIPFPGTTYPEVQRLAQFTVPESVTVLENGDLDVVGLGRIAFGFTATERGLFATGSTDPTRMGLFTSEVESADYDDDEPMTRIEFQNSIRRVLGVDLPLGEPTRLTRFTFHARQVEGYRSGRILLAGDAAHLFPAPGVALNAGMLDSVNLGWKLAATVHGWAPADLLDTYHHERHFAGERTLLHTRAQVALRRGHDPAAVALRELVQELLVDEQPLRRIGALIAGTDIRYPLPNPNQHALTGAFAPDLTLRTDQGTTSVAEIMHTARPILLDLADRAELREIANPWEHRIEIHTAETDQRPADALLIRPDAHIAWAATIDEPIDTAAPALRDALSGWFGAPRKRHASCPNRAV